MGNRQEVKYPGGAIGPDILEVARLNQLKGPIQRSGWKDAAASALGITEFASLVALTSACVRPAEVRPVQSPQPGRVPAADVAKPIDSQKSPETQKEAKPTLDIRLVKRNSLAPGSENTIQGEPVMAKGLDGKEKQLTSAYFLPGATVIKDDNANHHVKVGLNDEGSKLFSEILDGDYLDRKLKNNETVAIFIDGKFTWLSFYLDSRSLIIMRFETEDDATRLADLLNKEALVRQGGAMVGIVGKPQIPAVEAKPEAGWHAFRSIISPYQINYPKEWTSQQYDFTGLPPAGAFLKKGDLFLGEKVGGLQTAISISSEPIESWVKLEDYAISVRSQFAQLEKEGLFIIMDRKSKVDGRDAMFIGGRTTNGSVMSAVFIHKDRGWRVILTAHTSVIKQEDSKFMQMLSTFKFLSGK